MEFMNNNIRIKTLNHHNTPNTPTTVNTTNRMILSLPNHFHDDFLENIIKLFDLNMELNAISIPIIPESLNIPIYPLNLGLLVKLRKALKRLVKRKFIPEPFQQDYSIPLYVVSSILTDNAEILNYWTPNQLEHAACLLEEKCKVLSGHLYTLLDMEPLYPPITNKLLEEQCPHLYNFYSNPSNPSNQIQVQVQKDHYLLFRQSYVNLVNQYHASVKRPNVEAKEHFEVETKEEVEEVNIYVEGMKKEKKEYEESEESVPILLTSSVKIEEEELSNDVELVKQLSNLSREKCEVCGSKRQVYCGDCGGLRMSSTIGVLPERISLPFDVLLLVHWQESLHKCTGIHTRVMSIENQVTYEHWEKNAWHSLVASLDGDRDLLLFPSENACDIEEFQWNENPHTGPDGLDGLDGTEDVSDTVSSSSSSRVRARYRVVVLESNWKYGQGMARQIADYRYALGLSPLKCIKLTNIIGKYWKFHEKGHSAISTIEAIAHTATCVLKLKSDQNQISNSNSNSNDINVDVDDRNAHHVIRVHGNTNNTTNDIKNEMEKVKEIDKMKQLLLLFELERYRVLKAVNEDGKKPPRAMLVIGTGDSSWQNIYVLENMNDTNKIVNNIEIIDYNRIYLNHI